MGIELDLKSFNQDIDRIIRQVDGPVAKRSLDKTGRKVVSDAKAITPVDTGRLRNSIRHEVSDDNVEVGSDVEYALYVHEDLTKFHPVGEAKFIEKALRKNTKTFERIVVQEMERI